VSATLAHIHFYVLASRAMASSSGSPQICLLFFKKKERKKSSVAFCVAVVIQSLRFKKKTLQMQLERQMGTQAAISAVLLFCLVTHMFGLFFINAVT
jgi:hypothetical protein